MEEQVSLRSKDSRAERHRIEAHLRREAESHAQMMQHAAQRQHELESEAKDLRQRLQLMVHEYNTLRSEYMRCVNPKP